MSFSSLRFLLVVLLTAAPTPAQTPRPSPSSAHAPRNPASALDPGSVTNGVYRNKALGLSCKIPEAWVLRTDEMNAPPDDKSAPAATQTPAPTAASKVLLAAFSRPPEAKGEEINSSILIAAESVDSYPGLKEAAQYFGPLAEVAKAQGFTIDEEPYEIALGARRLVRGDFHKDVGSRVMRQSTLVLLSHAYAVSITLIAGTEDDVETLIDGLTFGPTVK